MQARSEVRRVSSFSSFSSYRSLNLSFATLSDDHTWFYFSPTRIQRTRMLKTTSSLPRRRR